MKPGTVSKILWHFTGGPDWDTEQNTQKTTPKDQRKAYDILKIILKSKFLKLSSYNELVKIIVPEITSYDWKKKEKKVQKNVPKEIKSSKVVCLADIPIQHIEYHAMRYGKFAIGFHRDAAIVNNFNPVFYTLHNSDVINSIYSGFTSINNIDTDNISSALSDIEHLVHDIESELSDKEIDDISASDISDHVSDIENEIDDISTSKDDIENSISNFVAFVKTFDNKEFNSIYCEREWRAIEQFNFQMEDIAMIIVPKEDGYYNDLIDSGILPNTIPINAWEDLIEH